MDQRALVGAAVGDVEADLTAPVGSISSALCASIAAMTQLRLMTAPSSSSRGTPR
jgi:hypothetical protein